MHYFLTNNYSLTCFTVNDALEDLARKAGVVKFVLRTDETPYLLIVREGGCGWSHVGQVQSPEQKIMINCIGPGTTQHEFLHALGMWHEQSRSDRDDYVTINFDNINEQYHHNFNTRSTESLDSPYDYASIMHYSKLAFSNNGEVTIDAHGHNIGQRSGASEEDILQLRYLYQCTNGPRRKAAYDENPCTAECQCWKDFGPCLGQDNFCQGSLVCSTETDMCVDAGTTTAPVPAPTAAPTTEPSAAPTTEARE